MFLIGDVKDRNVILIDDMIDTAGTLCKAAEILMKNGAKSVRAMATLTLGNAGKIVLGFLVASACLTTSVGLAATAGNFFGKHTRFKYETVVVVSSVFSLFMANFGVDKIIKISVPLLLLMYPMAMALIFLNSFSEKFKIRGTYIGAVVGAGFIGIIEALGFLGVKIGLLDKIYNSIPLAKAGYGFIVPAIVMGIIFTFIIKEKV
jgi:LIVCS family branched-chain amino acid:cation transporter